MFFEITGFKAFFGVATIDVEMLSDVRITGISAITLPFGMISSASFSWILILYFKSEMKLVFPILSVDEAPKLNFCFETTLFSNFFLPYGFFDV